MVCEVMSQSVKLAMLKLTNDILEEIREGLKMDFNQSRSRW